VFRVLQTVNQVRNDEGHYVDRDPGTKRCSGAGCEEDQIRVYMDRKEANNGNEWLLVRREGSISHGWKELLSSFEIGLVEGEHFSIMQPPHVGHFFTKGILLIMPMRACR
jgi:hypothetical protein